MRYGNVAAQLGHRSAGTLLGTRVVGALGRILVEEAFAALVVPREQLGFPGPHGVTLSVASYADNLFAVSTTPARAIGMLELVEARLEAKLTSRECMVAFGSQNATPDAAKWLMTTRLLGLGDITEHDGCTDADWRHAKTAMWKAFYANCAPRRAQRLALPSRLRLLHRVVLPGLDYRCTRWPIIQHRMYDLRRVQRNMTAIVMRVAMHSGRFLFVCVFR